MGAIEITGAIVGLCYLYYEYHASLWLWVFGVIMPLIYIYLYFSCGYYANMGLNIYYVGISLYGFLKWRRKGEEGESPIYSCSASEGAKAVIGVVMLTVVSYLVLGHLEESQAPLWDGLSTALSVVGMWMMARGFYQQWICWILSEPILVYLCYRSGMYPVAGMYLVYLVVAIFGYRNWKRKYDNSQK